MDRNTLCEQLGKCRRRYLGLDLSPGDSGQVPITKLSGVPWWPHGIERPRCVDGHLMSFIVQIRLDEVPGFDQSPTLLSFHYCDQCAHDGRMAWGWADAHRRKQPEGLRSSQRQQLQYALRIFSDLDKTRVDGAGVTIESSVPSQRAAYIQGFDYPNIEDIWQMFPETARPNATPDTGEEMPNNDVTKIGGWPSWLQHPDRPRDHAAKEMDFVGQLHMRDSQDTSWASGCLYLFASQDEKGQQDAEFLIQT